MNLWISLFIPLIILSFVARFVQYMFHKDRGDRNIATIVITAVNLVALVLIVMLLNGMDFNSFLFWMLIITVLIGAMHKSIDSMETNLRVNKEVSMFVVFAISTLITLTLFYYYFI